MTKGFRPFKQNDLFRPDFDRSDFNACVGDNGGPYDLYDYAHGYFDAARLLLKSVGKTGLVNDLLVYPICLNFRHAVEVFIKYLISDLAKLNRTTAKFQTTHSLEENWKTARQLIKKTKLDVCPDEITLITNIVRDIMEVDPNGNIFRYPESIKGHQHLKDWSHVNLAVVGDGLSAVFKVAEGWHFKIERRIEVAIDRAASVKRGASRNARGRQRSR